MSEFACLHLLEDLSLAAIDGDCDGVLGSPSDYFLKDSTAFRGALHPDDHKILEQALDSALLHTSGIEDHLRIRDQHGRYRVLVVALSAVAPDDPSNRRAALKLVIRDPRKLEQTLPWLPNLMISAVMESTDDFIFFKDTHHIMVAASQSMVGLCPQIDHWTQFPLVSDYELFPQGHADRYYRLEQEVYESSRVAHEVHPAVHRDRRPRWIDNRKYPIFDSAGQLIGLYGVARDVTAQIETLRRQALAASVFQNSAEGIVILDSSGSISDLNQAFERTLGIPKAELLGKPIAGMLELLEVDESYQAAFAEQWKTLGQQGSCQGELSFLNRHGEARAVLCRISAVLDDTGIAQHYVAMYSDISTFKEREHTLQTITHHDTLTGLPNRILLGDRATQCIARCNRDGSFLCIAYLDLDGFKQVNDRFGHATGDAYLAKIGALMLTALRDTDTLARIGGDEFVALIPDLEKSDDFEPVAARLLQSASARVLVDTKHVHCSASIGIARYPSDGKTLELLMRCADQAMYQAKQQGKNTICVYGGELVDGA